MAKNRKPRRINPLPSYDKLQTIDPDEFDTALGWYMNAAAKKAIVENPTNLGLTLIDENGKVSGIRFTDIPLNRGMVALKERYGNDSDKYFSVATRMFALFKILHDPALGEWMRRGEEITEVHPAVIDAAATVRINFEGNFTLEEFIVKVKELANTKYKDEE